MAAPMLTTRPAAWVRFAHGALECTVVSDGQIRMGAPHATFDGGSVAEIDALLTEAFLPLDRVVLEQNVLAVNTGTQLILFDCGAGTHPAFAGKTFGAGVGQTIANLGAAGITPEQVDILALTHPHSDHCWGLVDDDGRPRYPNAKILLSGEDMDFWMDQSRLEGAAGAALSVAVRDLFMGAYRALKPYLDEGRIVRLSDGDRVAAGITAHLRPGHSPGHLVYRIESEGELLTVWGDIAHHVVLLLAHPEWGFIYDADQHHAARTRLAVFDEVLAAGSAVLAYHFPFPGRGHLQRMNGRLHWIPLPLELA